MFKDYIEKSNFEDTGFSYALSLISGKYKMVILYCLMAVSYTHLDVYKRQLRMLPLLFRPPRIGRRYSFWPSARETPVSLTDQFTISPG